MLGIIVITIYVTGFPKKLLKNLKSVTSQQYHNDNRLEKWIMNLYLNLYDYESCIRECACEKMHSPKQWVRTLYGTPHTSG